MIEQHPSVREFDVLKCLVIFVGAGAGGLLRHAIGSLIQSRSGPIPPAFPLGTLVVNIAGCLSIGVLMVVTERIASESTRDFVRGALMVGLLGGFTTFSAFGKETLELVQGGQQGRAVVYVLASVLGGLGAVWLGWVAARAAA
ncbi:MAG: fluoride efflux transporter CrcB [Phycisphaerales bacterium]|nr:fluoride efflux transporter CrcB [Phycisphaerales bacterium]